MSEPKFTVLETISEGPTTTVYKAIQNVLGRTVLLKVLHRHLLQDRELTERFRREAAACAMLRSEHIVQVYNLDEVDGAPAIVMEYVEGESLKDYLARTNDRSESFARTVASSVLKGLVAAHRSGIIHRDIKPGNILVTPDGAVRLTDFGLAAVMASPSLTVEGVLVGTPAYMSPEQARGEPLDPRTDLFSLGITLVEAVTGSQLFHGTSYGECISRITHFRTESLDQFLGGVSAEFRRFVIQLLQPDREQRFSGAAEALSRLTGIPVSKLNGRKGRSLWPVAAVLGVLVLVAAGYFLRTDRPATGPPANGSLDSSGFARDSLTGSSPAAEASQTSSPGPEFINRPKRMQPVAGLSADAAPEDSGYVALVCTPWAKVYLDDEYIGTTPIAGSIRVQAGSHTIAFNNPHFTPIIRTITVRKNEELSLEADFLKNAGYLLFTRVDPWAEIYVDDQYRETTPFSEPLVVSSGTRRVRLHNPSFSDHVLELSVGAGDTISLSHDFRFPKNP